VTGASLTGNEGTAATHAQPGLRSRPRQRNLLLTLHITVAVAALGVDAALLILGITGLVSSDANVIRASYVTMDLLVPAALLPLALGALLTGILVALRTRWGLVRHYWVLAKLVLTIVAATAATLSLRPALDEAAATALALPLDELRGAGIGPAGVAVTVAPAVALLILITAVVLAVYKPWGQTRSSRR
jgi:hypothetical protein